MNTTENSKKKNFKYIYPISNTQNVAVSPMLTYFFQDSYYSIFFQYSPQFVLSVLDISAETSNTYSYLTDFT